MQDVATALACRLPAPESIAHQRHAVFRKAEGRQAALQACSRPRVSVRWSDRVSVACQASEAAANDPAQLAPLASAGFVSAELQRQATDDMQARARQEMMQLVELLPADMQNKLRSHPDFLQV